jgi:hypothetical protein
MGSHIVGREDDQASRLTEWPIIILSYDGDTVGFDNLCPSHRQHLIGRTFGEDGLYGCTLSSPTELGQLNPPGRAHYAADVPRILEPVSRRGEERRVEESPYPA